MTTMLDFSPEQIAIYRTSAQRNQAQLQAEAAPRQQRAWELAHKATRLLKERFYASRVVVFGSLVYEGSFTPWSDVDIAAWGIAPQDTFQAIGAVMDLSTEIEVNLVDVNTCRPSLLTIVEQDGVEI